MSSSNPSSSNPKHAAGTSKWSVSYAPMSVMEEVSRVFRHGADKYGKLNWRHSRVELTVYYDAAFRHLQAWRDGEDIDPESGFHHFAHVIAGMMIALDAVQRDFFVDERQPDATTARELLDYVARFEKAKRREVDGNDSDGQHDLEDYLRNMRGG